MFLAGELLFRNCFAALDALAMYEDAVRKAPSEPLFLSVLADRAMYLGFPEMAIPHLVKIGDSGLPRLARAYAASKQMNLAEKTVRRMIERNPYSPDGWHLLGWVLEQQGKNEESRAAKARLSYIQNKGTRPWRPVELSIYARPNGRKLDSVQGLRERKISVLIKNSSRRDVMLDSIRFGATEDGERKGVDAKKLWVRHLGDLTLTAGESKSIKGEWDSILGGATPMISTVFKMCWHGLEEDSAKQCEDQLIRMVDGIDML